jgi:hypothetical protein
VHTLQAAASWSNKASRSPLHCWTRRSDSERCCAACKLFDVAVS